MLTMEAALAIKDPALQSRWFIRVPDISSPYECVAESAEISFTRMPQKGRHYQGRERFYPDFVSIDSVTINFYETWDFQTSRWLKKWRSRIYKSDGAFGVPAEFKRDIYADMYRLDSNTPVLTLHLIGCWPTDKIPFSLTYDDEVGRIQCGVMFSVDDNDEEFVA